METGKRNWDFDHATENKAMSYPLHYLVDMELRENPTETANEMSPLYRELLRHQVRPSWKQSNEYEYYANIL